MQTPDTTWYQEVDFDPQPVSMLDRGDSGDDVRQLQKKLREVGYALRPDGVYGPATERIVRQFQKDVGVVVDGRVGPKTQARLDAYPKDPTVLTQEDIEDAAVVLDVSVASVMAINAVESRGSGFFAPNKPAILFERHIMYRRLKHYNVNPTPFTTTDPDIVNRRTGGYVGDMAEHDRLQRAQEIHEDSALESASWGLFQIMGFHWQRLGYASPQAFVSEMCRGERQQLMAFVSFIRADSSLHQALKERHWETVALRYNGPQGVSRGYHRKLANAFTRYTQQVV